MKILVVVVYACAVVTLGEGRTAGQRPTEGAETTEAPKTCPSDLVLLRDPDIVRWAKHKVIECITNTSAAARIHAAENRTLTWMRHEAEELCQAVPTVKKCLDGVVATTAVCLHHPREIQPFVNMMTSPLETSFVYLCADNEQAAKLFHGLIRHKFASSFRACNTTMAATLKRELQHARSTTEMSLKMYHSFHGLKDCLVDSIENDEELKILFEAYMENQIKNYKCISPGSNTLVLCDKLNDLHLNYSV